MDAAKQMKKKKERSTVKKKTAAFSLFQSFAALNSQLFNRQLGKKKKADHLK